MSLKLYWQGCLGGSVVLRLRELASRSRKRDPLNLRPTLPPRSELRTAKVWPTCGHNLVSQSALVCQELLRVGRPYSRRFRSEEVIPVGVSILLLEVEQRFVVHAEYHRRR